MTLLEPQDFAGLLAFLSEKQPLESGSYRTWTFSRVGGGANNLVYRVGGVDKTLAVKFCIHDERDRAGREYGALSLLTDLGLAVAPKAIRLDRERYVHPTVVQSWVEGEVMGPPATASDWETLLNYYAALHRVTPVPGTLLRALHTASSVAEGRALVRRQLERLPETAYPKRLKGLLKAFEAWTGPVWPQPRLSLCRVDPNPSNFIRTERGLRSVDWENSGWGDPAFELADLLAHPAYGPASLEKAAEVAERYAKLVADSTVILRIQTCFGIGLMYWVERFARTLYEVPRGLDARLVARPGTWQADTQRHSEAYLEHANQYFS